MVITLVIFFYLLFALFTWSGWYIMIGKEWGGWRGTDEGEFIFVSTGIIVVWPLFILLFLLFTSIRFIFYHLTRFLDAVIDGYKKAKDGH